MKLLVLFLLISINCYSQIEPEEMKNHDFYSVKDNEIVFDYFMNNTSPFRNMNSCFFKNGPGINGQVILGADSSPGFLKGLNIPASDINKFIKIKILKGNKLIGSHINFSKLQKVSKPPSEAKRNFDNYYFFSIPTANLEPGNYILTFDVQYKERKIRNMKPLELKFAIKSANSAKELDELILHKISNKIFHKDKDSKQFILNILKDKKIKDSKIRVDTIFYFLLPLISTEKDTTSYLAWFLLFGRLSHNRVNKSFLYYKFYNFKDKKKLLDKEPEIEEKCKKLKQEFFPDLKYMHQPNNINLSTFLGEPKDEE